MTVLERLRAAANDQFEKIYAHPFLWGVWRMQRCLLRLQMLYAAGLYLSATVYQAIGTCGAKDIGFCIEKAVHKRD